MYIPRLKKGKSLTKLPNRVVIRDVNQQKLKKIISNTAKLSDIEHKELKIIEMPKRSGFPYIGYFSSRKGKNENSDEKHKTLPSTLKNKAYDKNKASRVKRKPIFNNSIGMNIISILSNSQLPDILNKVNNEEKTKKLESVESSFLVLNNQQSIPARTPSVSNFRKSRKLNVKSKSETDTLVKSSCFAPDKELKNKLSDPYHIINITKNPHFTPFCSLLDCNEEVINKGFNFDLTGNKVVSLRRKVYEQRIKTGMTMKIC